MDSTDDATRVDREGPEDPMGVDSTAISDRDVDVLGRRVVAVIVDTIVVGLASGILGGLAGIGGLESLVVFAIPLQFIYFLLLEANWNGQTIGKRALGIAVVKEDGSPIELGDSAVRNLLRYIDGIAYYLVGFIFLVISGRNQRIGDMVANTIVVRKL